MNVSLQWQSCIARPEKNMGNFWKSLEDKTYCSIWFAALEEWEKISCRETDYFTQAIKR